MATMPGEPTISMGRRIERSILQAAVDSAGRRIFKNAITVGLANDYVSYMATIQEYEAYRYEGSFSLFGQQTGNVLKGRLVHLARLMGLGRPVEPCDIARNCLEPPDTSQAAIAPTPTAPDLMVGTTERQPVDVQRFAGTRFQWIGGGPSAEWRPGVAKVALQRQTPAGFVTVASDLDSDVPVHYDKCGGQHHWTAFFDPTADQPQGRYRFHVTGYGATAPGTTAPYSLDSAPFTVTPYTGLMIASTGPNTFSVANPSPDPLGNFHYRGQVDTSATVNGTLPSTFTLSPNQTLVVPPGGIVDANGNTNDQTITVVNGATPSITALPARPAPAQAKPALICADTAAAPVVPDLPIPAVIILLGLALVLAVGRRFRAAR
jgi:hypothetical protein